MSYHRLPFIRKTSSIDDNNIELLGSSKDETDRIKSGSLVPSSLLSTDDPQVENTEPLLEDDDNNCRHSISWRTKHGTGWRFGITFGSINATIVLLINLGITLWAVGSHKKAPNGGFVLYRGDCTKAKHINTAAHLLINILSTVLLSASNYCMQCLSAPTRAEVNQAHTKRTWADIGVPSVRNLRLVKLTNVTCWILLGLSSVPLHLL